MTSADRVQFLEIVVGFAELKGKQLSAGALELYWRSMQHWTLEAFRVAADQLVLSCEFMPTPKEFEDLRKAARPASGELWAVILESARRGARSIDLPPAAAKALAAVGGLNTIGMSDVSKTQFLERRFCEHYESIQDIEDTREAVPQLMRTVNARPQLVRGPIGSRALLPGMAEE
jgi:hypothetical protein